MDHAFFSRVQAFLDGGTPVALALVVRAEKPTSGKPGDKALIASDGSITGWIGGSCAQPTVIREALKALQDGKNRLIRLSPDPSSLTPREGLIDLPLTCFSGGTLEIYIEPLYPQPRLLVVGSLPVAHALVSLGRVMNYDVVMVDPDCDNCATEDAALVTSLDDLAQYVRPDTYVVVATHGNFDEAALEQVLKAKPRYVGLVASRKRFQAVQEYLREQGVDQADLDRVKAPAGLDIGAQGGDEIAVSILAEIIQRRRSAPDAANWDALPIVAETAYEPEVAPAAQPASGIVIDPVCLMDVEIATAKYTYDYEGKIYYFCAPGCKLAFRRNPEEYLHPAKAIDPVCGMEVETASAEYTSVYRERAYYFCGAGCKAEFDRHPDAYVQVMHH